MFGEHGERRRRQKQRKEVQKIRTSEVEKVRKSAGRDRKQIGFGDQVSEDKGELEYRISEIISQDSVTLNEIKRHIPSMLPKTSNSSS